MLIDIGANLTHESFKGDIKSVLTRAKESNVEKIIVTGTSVHSSREGREDPTAASEAMEDIKCATGRSAGATKWLSMQMTLEGRRVSAACRYCTASCTATAGRGDGRGNGKFM